MPNVVATHLHEHKVLKLSDAAVLADEFILTHKVTFSEKRHQDKYKPRGRFPRSEVRPAEATVAVKSDSSTPNKTDLFCKYCKKIGHLIADCFILKKRKKDVKPMGLVVSSQSPFDMVGSNTEFFKDQDSQTRNEHCDTQTEYAPFITDGYIIVRSAGKHASAHSP